MTPTAVDNQALMPLTAIIRRANPDPWVALPSEPGEQASSLIAAFLAIQRLHKPSSGITFAELPTAGFPTADQLISSAFTRMSIYGVSLAVEETASWDVEIDLPVWKGSPSFRAEGIVRSIRRPMFHPITEDDIGGV